MFLYVPTSSAQHTTTWSQPAPAPASARRFRRAPPRALRRPEVGRPPPPALRGRRAFRGGEKVKGILGAPYLGAPSLQAYFVM